MKIAHLIMAYKSPKQLERMIKAMDHLDFYFFIHLDKKIDISLFSYLSSLDRVYFIKKRTLCSWGGFSFVRAILNSLEEILGMEMEFGFYNLMSGQDYPIKPIKDIYNLYKENLGKCFISYDQDSHKSWWSHAVTRFQMYHLTDLGFKGKYFVQKLMNKYLPKRNFPIPVELYGSSISSWWSISEDCAQYVVDFMKHNPKLYNFMKYTWGADEFLIATIIMNSTFKKQVVNNNLRYITWSEGSPNPRILTALDFDAIVSSSKFFARKFDTTVDEIILNKLDDIIIVKN